MKYWLITIRVEYDYNSSKFITDMVKADSVVAAYYQMIKAYPESRYSTAYISCTEVTKEEYTKYKV